MKIWTKIFSNCYTHIVQNKTTSLTAADIKTRKQKELQQ